MSTMSINQNFPPAHKSLHSRKLKQKVKAKITKQNKLDQNKILRLRFSIRIKHSHLFLFLLSYLKCFLNIIIKKNFIYILFYTFKYNIFI